MTATPHDEEMRARKQRVDAARLALLERAPTATLKELLTATLDLAEELTGSQIGFFHFVGDDQATLWLQAWSTNTVARMCTAEGAGSHYPIDQAGVWADCVREGRPLVHNDYGSLPARKGMPPGHARVVRELTVPVMRAGRACAVLGVGNKPEDYDDRDVEDVAALADMAWDIAARKRVEEELATSEARYRDLVELSPDAIFVNRADRIEFLNRAALSLFGAARAEEVIGKSPLELFHPDSHALVRERIGRLLAGERVPAVRERVLRLDGTTREVDVAAAPCRDAQGNAIQVVLHDVTEQVRREEALQASERHFRELVRFVQVPISLGDAQGRILVINDRFTQVLGYTLQDIPTVHDWFPLAFPDEAYRRHVQEAWADSLRRAAATGGEVEPSEYQVTTRGGDVRAMLVSAVPVGENLLVTFVDVTDGKRAAEALRLQQARLDLAVRSGQAGLWDLDLTTNEAWRTLQHDRLFGYDELQPSWGPEDALRHVIPEDRPVFQKAMEDGLASGHFHYELRIDPANHPRRWIEATGEVHRDEAGKPVRMAGTVVDVTERKASEETVRALQNQLALASRLAAMGTLVAGVAHEINNPLAAVMAGQGVTLEASRELRKRLQERALQDPGTEIRQLDDAIGALEDAWEGAQRISGIVKDLAAIARPDATRTRVPLFVIAEQAVRWVRPLVDGEVTMEVQDLGAPDVLAAVGQIDQVVVKLLTNAAKATTPGRKGEVVVRVGRGTPGMARLEVVDHGVGIAPDILDRIFEPFFTTRPVGKDRGAGLGLAVCHAIVTQHGGTLTAESVPGQGATFRVELPAATGEA